MRTLDFEIFLKTETREPTCIYLVCGDNNLVPLRF